jgi:hypothetical protein
MRQKYQVSEKQMREVFGAKWPAKLATLVKDVDYVERKCFNTFKRVYREDILASLETIVQAAETIVAVDKLEPEQASDLASPSSDLSKDRAVHARITKCYPNPRYVETTVGKVFVGGKRVKVGQTILVRGACLVLK